MKATQLHDGCIGPYTILSNNLLASGFFKIVENLPMAYPLDTVQDYCELIPLLLGSLKVSFKAKSSCHIKDFFTTQYSQ